MCILFNTTAKISSPIEKIETKSEKVALFRFKAVVQELDEYRISSGIVGSEFSFTAKVSPQRAGTIEALQIGQFVSLNGVLRRSPFQDKRTGEQRFGYDFDLAFNSGINVINGNAPLAAAGQPNTTGAVPVGTPQISAPQAVSAGGAQSEVIPF